MVMPRYHLFQILALKILILFAGIVLEKRSHDKKDSLNMDKGNLNSWEINAKFNSITFWNHDNLPSPDDTHMRCFHWFAVAKAVSFYFLFIC